MEKRNTAEKGKHYWVCVCFDFNYNEKKKGGGGGNQVLFGSSHGCRTTTRYTTNPIIRSAVHATKGRQTQTLAPVMF